MAIETELLVKVSSGGAAQTVRDVQGLNKAIAQLGKDSKDSAALAKQLGKAFDLDPSEVEDLAKALGQAKAATEGAADAAGTYRDSLGKLRDANGRFVKDTVDGFDRINREGQGLGGALDKVFTGFFEGLGRKGVDLAVQSIQALGAAIVDTAGKALEVAGAFDAAGAKVDTLGVDSDALAQRLAGVADGLQGQANQVELLEGSYDIVSAGFSDIGDVAKIAEASVKGATGGFSDFATVSDGVTSALNAYGESADQAESFVDKFIATQNAGKITVDQYAQQIGKLAPTAALAGVGIDQLNGFIATATAQGVPVESTFAGIRQALSSVLKPTKEAADKAKELGINFDAAALKTVGLDGILTQLSATGNDGADTLLELFGSVEAVAAIAPSAGANLGKLNENIDASANSAGAAASAFQIVSDTIPGLQTALQNQLTDGFLSLGNAIAPVQAGLLEFAGSLLSATIEGSEGLGQLTAASERFQAVLTGNPEIVERLAQALATVADEGVKQISLLIDAITAFVSEQENIDNIASTFEDLAVAVQTAGQGARFIIALTEVLIRFQGTVEGLPDLGGVLNFNPINPINSIKQIQGVFESLVNVIRNTGEFVANLIARFDFLANSPILKVLLAQILDTDAAVSELGSSVGSSLTGAAAALGQAGGEVQKNLAAVADSAVDAGDKTVAAAETIEDALKRLGDTNKNSLADLSTTAANARAAILEAGGDPAKLAVAEAKALNDRITANKAALAELTALQTGSLGAEDAAAAADQIRSIEGQLASDRVSLAQNTLAEKKRTEKESADAAKAAAEVKQKADEAAAKKTTDALKTQRDEEKRIADERQAEQERLAKAEFDTAKTGRTEARETQRRAEDKAAQDALQADDRAFQGERRASDKAFQKSQQGEAQAFQKSQQAAADAFQKRLDAERDQGGREFDVLTSEVDRRVQLEEAVGAAAKKELQDKFKLEAEQAERRKQIEAEVLAQRGQVLSENQGALELSPLEAARAAFEEQLQAKAAAFQEGQQAAAQAFQESQADEVEARSEALRLADEQRADELAAAAEAKDEARRQQDKAFEESERAIQESFEAAQRAATAAFNAQQRAFDEASAARIAAILAAAKPAALAGARREGGPVRAGGAYLVGEAGPEIVTMRRGGFVWDAQQTAALLGQGRRLSVAAVGGGTGRLEQQMDQLLKEVRKGRTVRPQTTYNLATEAPVQDAIALQMAEIRALVRGRGL